MSMKYIAILTTSGLLAAAGCTGNIDQFGGDAGPSGILQIPDAGGAYVQREPADVLFVVDNSGSMAVNQSRLAQGFQSFIAQVEGQGDFRIGVVSTDLDSSAGEWAGFAVTQHSPTSPFHLRDLDTSACLPAGVDHGCFRGPLRVLDAQQQSRTALITGFQDNVEVLGTCGSGTERGLDSMIHALEVNGCQPTPFLRPNANLIVVFLTDEEDAGETAIPDYVQALARFKAPERTRVAVIAGVLNGRATACNAQHGAACGSICMSPPPAGSQTSCASPLDCPAGEYCDNQQGACENEALRYWAPDRCHWCTYYNTPDCCEALPASRYVEFARTFERAANAADPSIPVVGCDGTGGRPVCLLESICQDRLHQSMGRIARLLMLDAPS